MFNKTFIRFEFFKDLYETTFGSEFAVLVVLAHQHKKCECWLPIGCFAMFSTKTADSISLTALLLAKCSVLWVAVSYVCIILSEVTCNQVKYMAPGYFTLPNLQTFFELSVKLTIRL